jgi:single-stranded DNA-binding protein
VFGRIKEDRWETETGDKRSRIEVVANDIAKSMMFIGAKAKR